MVLPPAQTSKSGPGRTVAITLATAIGLAMVFMLAVVAILVNTSRCGLLDGRETAEATTRLVVRVVAVDPGRRLGTSRSQSGTSVAAGA